MKMKSIYIFLFVLCNADVYGFASKNIESKQVFKKFEIQLIQLLQKDSLTDITIDLDSKIFRFGIQNENKYTNLQILKHGKEIYIQPLGTGELYQIKNNEEGYEIQRIDETYHSGASFFSNNFFLRDTLFQYGGIGFWNMRGFFTFFSHQTNQWEMYQANRQVINFYSYDRHNVMKFLHRDKLKPKYYTTNSFAYANFPSSFEVVNSDSTFVFDFNKREWQTLGKTTPETKKIVTDLNQFDFSYNKYLIGLSGLDFYWIDFENNQIGKFKTQKIIYLRQRWLNMYNKESKESLYNFQFSLNDNESFFCRINLDGTLSTSQINFTKDDFDFTSTKPIYIESNTFWSKYSSLLYKLIWPFLLVILMILGYFIYVNNYKKKNSLPKKVNEILNNNFFQSLSIVEKELIETLLNHAKKEEFVSTKQINKIIGVQHKDIVTQNKSRSDYFIKINQKYKLATQQEESLIIKERDKDDKRQYNYSIHPNYIKDIETLLKD